MQLSTVLQALFGLALIAATIWIAALVSDSWADWVVFGVIILTVIGAARAVHVRRYPTKKRTFIRSSGPDQRK